MTSGPPPEEWEVLTVSEGDCPAPSVLAYRFIGTSHGVSLYVTDLIHLWETRSDRAAITTQARNCPIDPTDDDSQFDVLVSKLRDGLAGRNGAMCKVGGNQAGKRGHLQLHLRLPLPSPLPALHWTFDLRQCAPMVLTRELLLPCLEAELVSYAKAQDLTKTIKQKDHVIQRLMDKIEQTSIDLSLVFPGFGVGRKGLNARQAAKTVPGIAPFNQTDWSRRFSEVPTAPATGMASILQNPTSKHLHFDGPQFFYEHYGSEKRFGHVQNWSADWVDFCKVSEPVFTEDEVSEDGAKSKRWKTAQGVLPGLPVQESTDAFEDLSQPTRAIAKSATPTNRRARSQSTSSSETDRSLTQPRRSRLGTAGRGGKRKAKSSTGSDSDEGHPEPSSKPKSEVGKKRKKKLGTLGGRRNRGTTPAGPEPQTQESPIATLKGPPTGHGRKLGVLGGRKPLPRLKEMHHSGTKTEAVAPAKPEASTADGNGAATTRSRNLGPRDGKTVRAADDLDNDDLDAAEATESPSPEPESTASGGAEGHLTRRGVQPQQQPQQQPPPPPQQQHNESPVHERDVREDQTDSQEDHTEVETTAQKADRKREELKRSEAAVTGQGVAGKKKRRF